MKNSLKLIPKLSLTHLIVGVFASSIILVAGIYMSTFGSIQEISGIINDYTQVTAISDNILTVSDASDFAANDKVLIIQMKGATISEVDNANYGDITDWGSAGIYEFNLIKEINGNQVSLQYSTCKTYSSNDLLQLIRVPVYDSVRVNGTLEAKQWDGSTGGVLVLFAEDRIRVDANLSAEGMGFMGGEFNGSAIGRSLTYVCDVSSGMGGRKGEGIVEVSRNGCRGKLANGGGGGNDHNGGGGGGGNYGAGGQGGHGWLSNSVGSLTDTDKGGRGGYSIQEIYDDGITRLFMGGGGGGGHQNNGASFRGGDGGGIIIVVSPELYLESSVNFDASGVDAQDITINDGGSGGGAGGSILLEVDNFINPSNLSLNVSGGDGADIRTYDQHGPGGGGGGGLINSPSEIPASISTDISGGNEGIFYSVRRYHVYHGTSHGAAGGDDGGILTNLVLQECSTPPALDLNGEKAGTDWEFDYFPDGPDVPILGDDVAIADSDDTHMFSATIILNNPIDGANEYIKMGEGFNADSSGISVSIDSSGHSISLTGYATIEMYQHVLGQIVYGHEGATVDSTNRQFLIIVNDGGAESNLTVSTLNFVDVTLPVSWAYFKAKAEDGNAILEWATSRETNNSFFEVQRSYNSLDFDLLSTIQAKGNSNALQEYAYEDTQLFYTTEPVIYYRLKQVDVDGHFQYSPLVSINMIGMDEGQLKMKVPNPVSTSLPISLTGPSGLQGYMRLHSIDGQLVKESPVSGHGFVSLSWELSGVDPGMYILSFSGSPQNISKRILIQR